MFFSFPPVQVYAYRKKDKIKEYFFTCKTNQNFWLCPDTAATMRFQVLQSGAGKWLWKDFLFLNVEFPLITLKILKGGNWSLMVNLLSQTVQARPPQTVFIYPYYYSERIILWMPLLSKVHCFDIDLKSMNLYQKSLCMSAVGCFVCSYLTVPESAIIV